MRVFIGCSGDIETNVSDFMRVLQSKLEGCNIELIYWRDFFDDPGQNSYFNWPRFSQALGDLEDRCNCAIMVWHGDDVATIRDNEVLITRDNVILETGAFLNARGLSNVFIITDTAAEFHFATDLQGVNTYGYDFKKSALYPANNAQVVRISDRLKSISNKLPPDPSNNSLFPEKQRIEPASPNQVAPVLLPRRKVTLDSNNSSFGGNNE